MNKELIDHILEKSTTPEDRIERAYALGLHENVTKQALGQVRLARLDFRRAQETIERQNKDLQHITQLVYENSMQAAKYFALDNGWCIACYTYDCYGDCKHIKI